MKRFYREVSVAPDGDGWRVLLDGRAIKTPGGRAQIVHSCALADAMAAEWAGQSIQPDAEIDLARFALRGLADHMLDAVAPGRGAVIAELIEYAQTDTLYYCAKPDDPLYPRQQEAWEPILIAAEARYDVHFVRVVGVMHRLQPEATIARLGAMLTAASDADLTALREWAGIAASLVIALAALADPGRAGELFDAAELEADWQIELWGKDAEAEARRALRRQAFVAAARFMALARP